ncbi:probable protein phosphatase 2C 55 isoform X2 [Andrographis paniculata]|uniref:probable protein phosphatase 2C 55 isoform X2 n=1 Tax=Andrographis paniculata TaxID=175694 RepID=UPI0021E78ACD|nr:probable protein phosphatase 2C 55 isoform X2 [Andrographis paniculata]
MASSYFARNLNGIRNGVGRLSSGIGHRIRHQEDNLAGQGNVLFGQLRLINSFPSGRSVLCFPLEPSFQVFGRFYNTLLSERCHDFSISSGKAFMAVYGSGSAVCECIITSRQARSFIAGCYSCRERRPGNFLKPTMSWRSEEQINGFRLNGRSMNCVSKTNQNGKQLCGYGFKGLHILSSASYSTSAAGHVSVYNTTREEQQLSSANSPELKLNSGSYYLPHPDKEETGGEDAHFICSDEHAIGVADGVGGWADLGIDAGKYSRELMFNSINALKEEPRGSVNPARVLEKAYSSTHANGSSTACIIAITNKGLHAINLGDSGFMVVREGCTVFRSPVQLHDFNFTYQLESGNAGDLPGSGQWFRQRELASGLR